MKKIDTERTLDDAVKDAAKTIYHLQDISKLKELHDTLVYDIVNNPAYGITYEVTKQKVFYEQCMYVSNLKC